MNWDRNSLHDMTGPLAGRPVRPKPRVPGMDLVKRILRWAFWLAVLSIALWAGPFSFWFIALAFAICFLCGLLFLAYRRKGSQIFNVLGWVLTVAGWAILRMWAFPNHPLERGGDFWIWVQFVSAMVLAWMVIRFFTNEKRVGSVTPGEPA